MFMNLIFFPHTLCKKFNVPTVFRLKLQIRSKLIGGMRDVAVFIIPYEHTAIKPSLLFFNLICSTFPKDP